jgi:hypothetical protein
MTDAGEETSYKSALVTGLVALLVADESAW